MQLIGEAGVGKSRLVREFLGTKKIQFDNEYRVCFHIENLLSPLHPILALARLLGKPSRRAASDDSAGLTSASVLPDKVSVDDSESTLLSDILSTHEKYARGYSILEREKLFSSIVGSLKRNHIKLLAYWCLKIFNGR